MTWEPRPVPDMTPETAPFWRAASNGKLLLRECSLCDLIFYYPRARCPDCLSDDVNWLEASGTGIVYSYSVSEQISGWPDEDLPLVVAYVELDEGPRMMTIIVSCNPSEVSVGSAVEVRFIPTEDGEISIPVFTIG